MEDPINETSKSDYFENIEGDTFVIPMDKIKNYEFSVEALRIITSVIDQTYEGITKMVINYNYPFDHSLSLHVAICIKSIEEERAYNLHYGNIQFTYTPIFTDVGKLVQIKTMSKINKEFHKQKDLERIDKILGAHRKVLAKIGTQILG